MDKLEPEPGFYDKKGYREYEKQLLHHATAEDLDILQENRRKTYEANKIELRQFEDVYSVDVFYNSYDIELNKFMSLLIDIKKYNPNKGDRSFVNRLVKIWQDICHFHGEIVRLCHEKKNELDKGLSPEKIRQFLQFEADESHVEDQCQVCLEKFEVGRLMKQLDCGGRHSFCSDCIGQWFANHKTCPICRHIFV